MSELEFRVVGIDDKTGDARARGCNFDQLRSEPFASLTEAQAAAMGWLADPPYDRVEVQQRRPVGEWRPVGRGEQVAVSNDELVTVREAMRGLNQMVRSLAEGEMEQYVLMHGGQMVARIIPIGGGDA